MSQKPRSIPPGGVPKRSAGMSSVRLPSCPRSAWGCHPRVGVARIQRHESETAEGVVHGKDAGLGGTWPIASHCKKGLVGCGGKTTVDVWYDQVARRVSGMAAKFSDQEINVLLKERKPLPPDCQKRMQLRNKRGHKERDLDIEGANGNQFRIILRQSDFNPFDFSIILAVCPRGTNQPFRLRRYNGRSHEHKNQIEGDMFYDFHVHTATERYQDLGMKEDSYAKASDQFSDFDSALHNMIEECGVDVPTDGHPRLF